jgi:peroxiredoxin
MVATLFLLGCVLVPGQTMTRPAAPAPGPIRPAGAVTPAPGGGDWLLVPRLGRSQELVYRGTYTEEGREGRVVFNRAYRIETRVFVLDTPPRGAEVAVLTVLKHRDPPPGTPRVSAEPPASSVRLERLKVDLQGRVTAPSGVSLAVPLEGAPGLECGAFVALPGGRVGAGQEWQTVEEGRPLLTWRAAGTEMVGGAMCIKLVGEQQSDDWDRPRGDRAAWWRRDTVWLALGLGVARRVEREIKHREPAHQEATQRSLLRYELESSFQYAGEPSESRRQEITQALTFRDSLMPLLAQPSRCGPHLTALVKKIDYHLENQPDTPYRAAVLSVKRRAQAALRGESPPEPPADTRPAAPAVAALGQPAPPFMASQLTAAGSVQLRQWLGRPVLLVFYHPSSPTAAAVLRYAQRLYGSYPRRLVVAGMSVSDDAEVVRKQHGELRLTFPVLSASGLRASYGVSTTPKIVILDAAGIVRGEYLGWGQETPGEVLEELKRWLPAAIALPPPPG